MYGPQVLAQTLSVPALTRGANPQPWQYHSRGARHSITPCWGVLLDLLVQSPLLREHVRECKVVFGLDHEMHDFAADRPKKLDLVIARPSTAIPAGSRRFDELPSLFDMVLTTEQVATLDRLPIPVEGAVGATLLALEAKAMFTAFSKSYPRFYDELNSSHRAIHGSSSNALAIGLALLNTADQFVSPIINPLFPQTGEATYSSHNQPKDVNGAIAKVQQLPRRTGDGMGYDGLGIILLDCVNDGRPVTVSDRVSVPANYRYDRMITRMANEYDVRFRNI